jgi:IS5 family transposase
MKTRSQILAICVGPLLSLARKVLQQIPQRIVQQAKEAAVIAGKKLRTDTTAVETNIHHPTDSSLLADSLRVMHRYLQRIAEGCHASELRIVNHARAAGSGSG